MSRRRRACLRASPAGIIITSCPLLCPQVFVLEDATRAWTDAALQRTRVDLERAGVKVPRCNKHNTSALLVGLFLLSLMALRSRVRLLTLRRC